jgi:hypothetical protein
VNCICDKSASANKLDINIDIYLGIWCQYQITKQTAPCNLRKHMGQLLVFHRSGRGAIWHCQRGVVHRRRRHGDHRRLAALVTTPDRTGGLPISANLPFSLSRGVACRNLDAQPCTLKEVNQKLAGPKANSVQEFLRNIQREGRGHSVEWPCALLHSRVFDNN